VLLRKSYGGGLPTILGELELTGSAASCFGRPLPPGHRVASTNATGVPFATRSATRSASQFVRRTQPCDSAFETFPGEGVP
jgi:hypothetical protein